jgi:hypothetical protein
VILSQTTTTKKEKKGDNDAATDCRISERACGMLKNGPRAKHLTLVSLWKVSMSHVEKSKGFVLVARDSCFMAMVKCSAKTRLHSQLVAEFLTMMTHATRKMFACDICRHCPSSSSCGTLQRGTSMT